MLVFRMSVEVAEEFYRRCAERGANTEETRTALLLEMAKEGLIDGLTHTNRTKEQYIKDISREQNVLDLTTKEGEEGEN